MFACRRCGRIWAPANEPGTCPCGQATERVGVRLAVRLNAARQDKLRERAARRAAERKQARRRDERRALSRTTN
jgi:hypothetical protein